MSKKILIIGATGSIGTKLRKTLLDKTDYKLTLFSTRANKLKPDPNREIIIQGDALKTDDLKKAIENQDVVFAALSGNLGKMAKNIVDVMEKLSVKRLIFITSMGIYNEVPGEDLSGNSILKPYRDAADVIEASKLDYTIIRPGWFDNGSDNYELTKKGEKFKGHDVSRQAICNLVLKLIKENGFGVKESLGINRPQ